MLPENKGRSLALSYSLRKRAAKKMAKADCSEIEKFAEGGEVKEKDPSLESETPDIDYANGTPMHKGRMLVHPLSYQNAKAEEANQKNATPEPVQKAYGGSVSDAILKERYAKGGEVTAPAEDDSDMELDPDSETLLSEKLDLTQDHSIDDSEHDNIPADEDESLAGQILRDRRNRRRGL